MNLTTIPQVRGAITHQNDGPVTAFVIISRATELVKNGLDPELAANAIYEELAWREHLSDHLLEQIGQLDEII